ncbi:reverse transcriptase domain-containing protein [Tanacetum coccineum]
MELLTIEGKTLKDQEDPLGIITEDKARIGSPNTEDLTMDCSLTYPKAQERSSPQNRQLKTSNNLLVYWEVDGPETRLNNAISIKIMGVKKKEKVSDTRLGEWKKGGKDTTSFEALILMIRRRSYNPRKRPVEGNNSEVREITFPPLQNISSADPVVIKSYVSGRQVNRITIGEGPLTTTKILNFVIVGSNSPHNIILGRTTMQQIGIVVSTIHGALKFHTPQGIGTVFSQYNPEESEEEQRATNEEHQEEVKDILSCVNAKERIVVNDQYLEQTITIGRQLPTKIKIRAQSKQTQTLGTSKAKEEKLGARKKQSNAHLSGRAYEGQHFTRSQVSNVGLKPCHREKGQWKMEAVYAYKGYHQILIAEKDEEKMAFYTREGVFYYKRLPFGLKNVGTTYQRLIEKVFSHQLGRNMEVNADDIVIKSNDEEEMLADIKETLDGLWAINLKLNPKKCSFGVEEGIFSGHLITKQ